ncbi:MAG TPA: hypothetical protein VK889_04495, partial [Solirubrobacterales bacterium]|nr:hypothetical protein [Solirubrobacterales bacterium]
DDPMGWAINQATGDLDVRDRDTRRVQQFSADGDFIRMWGWDVVITGAPNNVGTSAFEVCDVTNGNVASDCKIGTSGTNDGQFGSTSATQTGIAVQQSTGDVFVADAGSTSNRRVLQFEADGTYLARIGSNGAPFGNGFPTHIAVDDDTLYATDSGSSVARYDLDPGAFLPTLTINSGGNTNSDSLRAMQIDPDTGNLLIAQEHDTHSWLIAELSSPATTATEVDQHVVGAGFNFSNGNAFAPNPDSGELVVAGFHGLPGHLVAIADDDGAPPADADILPATGVTESQATLHGEITTSDPLATNYRIEYSPNGIDWFVAGSGQVPGPVTDEPVSAVATNLLSNNQYRTRLITSRAFGNPEFESAELTFLTDIKAPDMNDVRATAIDQTTAILQARINPNGSATTYRFEYGAGNFLNTIPVPDAAIGAVQGYLFVSQPISGLKAGTAHQARLVATSAAGASTSSTVSFRTLSAPPAPSGRAYELVSPADKVGGVGVGLWGGGTLGVAPFSGGAATLGERFAVGGWLGSILLDGATGYGADWAFAERTDSGWVSSSPVTHAASNQQIFRTLQMMEGNPSLSTVTWASNGNLLRPFPELAPWPGIAARFVGDWEGRWELLAPTALDQIHHEEGTNGMVVEKISADGSTLLFTAAGSPRAAVGGMAGPGDPAHPQWNDLVAGGALYLDDISAGLSDRFEGNGVYSNAGVCADDTQIPERNGSSKLEDQSCAAPGAGRDATLISPRGAAADVGGVIAPNAISADGSRAFFLSPDPAASGVPTAGCTGTGAGSICTPQLYVRQRNADDTVTTRWISKAEPGLFGNQDATLTGGVRFAGASTDGDKVFFQTNSPLTEDDPNGTGAPVPGGVLTGAPSNSSWDLYMYDLPDGPDADPATTDADPAGGTLTRVSAGPTGAADCNVVSNVTHNSLRFASDDGSRAYFTCAAPLAGAAGAPSGSITSPSGTAASTDATNLYAYDGDSWGFVARLPKAGDPVAVCSTTSGLPHDGMLGSKQSNKHVGFDSNAFPRCLSGSADGAFLTLWTTARLSADDPDSVTVDGYAYDADRAELSRITAPQGGVGGAYTCNSDGGGFGIPVVACNADSGFGVGIGNPLGVVTHPATPGDRIAYFQSRSRLVAADTDNAYDVYEWRNGKLGLITTGQSPFGGNVGELGGSFYKGNTADGRNVYFATHEQLSWQDNDAVLDIYTARVGGGIPEPQLPPACAVLADACQGAASAAPAAQSASSAAFTGAGNVVQKQAKPKPRKCAKGKVRKGKKCVKKGKAKRAKRSQRHNRGAAR